jgi:alpha-L-rhamnosidase
MKDTFHWIIPIIVFFLFACKDQESVKSSIHIQTLLVNYLENPLGLDDAEPSFSWKMTSAERGKYQTAYQVLVSSSQENLDKGIGEMWDSGIIQSENSIHIPYKGNSLLSGQRYYWKVRIWDEKGLPSYFSEQAWFEMGKLDPEDWTAKWISQKEDSAGMPVLLPAPYFRREFKLEKDMGRARRYISGLGYYIA